MTEFISLMPLSHVVAGFSAVSSEAKEFRATHQLRVKNGG
jgi:hypothetical protein